MKSLLKDLSKPINDEMKIFNDVFKSTLKSDIKLINSVVSYVCKKKGKQLRARICLLSAKICGLCTKDTYLAAALIEMIHVATLIHDDIIDDSSIRRGWPSINRIWKNKIAILIGDYMFSKALSSLIKLKNFDALEILSNTAERLSQGEIMQIEKAFNKDITENTYLEMISDKTASLFSATCSLGAITVNASEQQCNAMKNFGEKLGLIFQIKDDLFDIAGNSKGIGKPVGLDVKKNMLTLPFIHALSHLGYKDKICFQRKLKKYSKRKNNNEIKKLINSTGSLDYTIDKINKLAEDAILDLEVFDDSIYKDALLKTVEYSLVRNS